MKSLQFPFSFQDGDPSMKIDEVCPPPIAALARLGSLREFAPRSLVIEEGEIGDSLFVLIEGRIRIFSQDLDGRRFVIGTFGPGTLFGEGSLDGGPRTASVEAVSQLLCATVPYASVTASMTSDPAFAVTLLMELIVRSRATARRMKSLALDSVYQRLRILIDNQPSDANGMRQLGLDWSQQEIADRLGASRDMVAKIFRELTKGGYIRVGRKAIQVLKSLPKAW